MNLALSTPFQFTVLPMSASMTAVPQARSAAFEVNLSPEAVLAGVDHREVSLDILTSARDRTGRQISIGTITLRATLTDASLQKIKAFGLAHKGKIELPDGATIVRFVVVNRVTGGIGSTDVTVPGAQP